MKSLILIFALSFAAPLAYADAADDQAIQLIKEKIREVQKSMRPADGCDTLESGTCYYLHDCDGESVHEDNGPESCPSGYGSFQYDMNVDNCGCFSID
jgi:hypothetical protein